MNLNNVPRHLLDRMKWMQDAMAACANKERVLATLANVQNNENEFLHEVDQLINDLSTITGLDKQIMDSVAQSRSSGMADGLDEMINQRSMARSIEAAYQVGFLKNLKGVIQGQLDLDSFIANGTARLAAIFALMGEEQCKPYLELFRILKQEGSVNLRVLGPLIARAFHDRSQDGCDHVHDIKIVASQPDGSQRTLYNGKIDFSMNARSTGSRSPVSSGLQACASCGGTVELGMCMDCGAKICPFCGYPNKSLDKCEQCGKRM